MLAYNYQCMMVGTATYCSVWTEHLSPDLVEGLLFVPVPRVRPLVLQQLTIGLHSFIV